MSAEPKVTNHILELIVEKQRANLIVLKKKMPFSSLQENIAKTKKDNRRFFTSLQKAKPVALIAEIKRASPSAGPINSGVDVAVQAKIYEDAGATAISVLSNSFFSGTLTDLTTVRSATTLPLLRKDFIIDPYQLYESKYAGADAVLLIASILTAQELQSFSALAAELGLDCLVEVHQESDIEKISTLNFPLVGINRRNLETFSFDLGATKRLCPLLPQSTFIVAESGITNRHDVEQLLLSGIKGILVGTTLMRDPNVATKVKELTLR